VQVRQFLWDEIGLKVYDYYLCKSHIITFIILIYKIISAYNKSHVYESHLYTYISHTYISTISYKVTPGILPQSYTRHRNS
jgi:hypothetical protein